MAKSILVITLLTYGSHGNPVVKIVGRIRMVLLSVDLVGIQDLQNPNYIAYVAN